MDVLASKLKALLGPKGWIGPEQCQPWQRDWLDQYGEVPLGVARPKSTAEVADSFATSTELGWEPKFGDVDTLIQSAWERQKSLGT